MKRYGGRTGEFIDTFAVGGLFRPSHLTFIPPGAPGDVDYGGDVDLEDREILLENYGVTSGADYGDGDIDDDGDVDLSDLAALLAEYGTGRD